MIGLFRAGTAHTSLGFLAAPPLRPSRPRHPRRWPAFIAGILLGALIAAMVAG